MKKGTYSVRIDDKEKARLKVLADNHDMTFTGLLTEGAKFYGAFAPEFLEQLEIASNDMKLPKETLLIHWILDRVAKASAWVEVFGKQPPGFMRCFQWDSKGKIISGNDLSEKLHNEYRGLFQTLKTKAAQVDTGEPVHLTSDEAYFLASAFVQEELAS